MNKEKFVKNLLESDLEHIYGQEGIKKQLKSALLAGRHVILVGAPGIGKTTLAKNVSELLPENEDSNAPGVEETEPFVRVQGSPDLTAEDLIGDIDPIKAVEYGPLSVEAFAPGKIFRADGGILFFDEINRCSEKLQNALLQALEERKVTIGSYMVDFDVDFIFIGTMNPEDSSTEPLSDVFLDRFDLIYMGYPEDLETEVDIVRNSGGDICSFPDKILEAVIKFIRDLRLDENIERKPSVRAGIGVYERAQANAVVNGRDEVNSQDVADVVVSVLAHRMSLKPSVKYLKNIEDYVREKFEDFAEGEGEGL